MSMTETRPQHEVARERANDVRRYRGAVKRDVAAGRLAVADVIASRDPRFHDAMIVDILRMRWPRNRGPISLRGRERLSEIPPHVLWSTLGELSDAQRQVLLARIGDL